MRETMDRLQDLARLLILFDQFHGDPDEWLAHGGDDPDDRRFLLALSAGIATGAVDPIELSSVVLEIRELMECLPTFRQHAASATDPEVKAVNGLLM